MRAKLSYDVEYDDVEYDDAKRSKKDDEWHQYHVGICACYGDGRGPKNVVRVLQAGGFTAEGEGSSQMCTTIRRKYPKSTSNVNTAVLHLKGAGDGSSILLDASG